MKTPRPGPIVAAAVLLIVVGSERLMAATATGLFVIVWGGVGGCGNCCLVLFPGPALLAAGNFLRTGLGLLRGTIEDSSHASGVTGLVGVTGVVASLVSAIWWIGLARPRPASEGRMLLAFLFALWANTVGVLTACGLLRKGDAEYLRWRAEIHRVPEDAGYEPEEHE